MILSYLSKIFVKNRHGKFRKTFIFPLLAMILGSYIIFMTLSIMNGMESNIINRFSSFDYEYFIENINEPTLIDLYENGIIQNEGFTKTVHLKTLYDDKYIYLNSYKDVDKYLIDCSSEYFIRLDKTINESFVYIGYNIALDMNLDVGDNIVISNPSEINLASMNIPNVELKVAGIFKFDIYDFDTNYIISSINSVQDIFRDFKTQYYVNDLGFENIDIQNKKSSIQLLISALRLEKFIYSILGYLVILITSVMTFNIMMLSFIEKNKQIQILNMLGVDKILFFKTMFLQNILLSLFLCYFGYFLTECTLYLNYKFNLFESIFFALPFKVLPLQIAFGKILVINFTLSVVVATSGALPIFFNINKRFYKC